jgi:ribosomal protein S18 acetylase RimI-like enzyme
VDERIQLSVVEALATREHTLDVGPFVLGWNPDNDSRYLSYATPRPGREIRGEDVALLIETFRSLGRTPRLEYVVSAAPALEELLLAGGFQVEARHDYLVCTPSTFRLAPVPPGFSVFEPRTDDDLRDLAAAQREAFEGIFEGTDEAVERGRRTQQRGGILALARAADGEAAGGGQASVPTVGLTEVGGIATRAAFRKRGVAAAVVSQITARAFEKGVEAGWLEAETDQSWRVYERVGYVPTGKRLYISVP